MDKRTVRSVERALDILLCFIDQQELSLTEISKRVALNKSTVYRLLATIETKGFVLKNTDTDKYQLGFRLWELTSHLTRIDDPALMLLPEMERLRDIVNETVTLYVRNGKERVRIQSVESNQTIRRVAPIGERMPLTVGASGKILVAYAQPDIQESILQEANWSSHIEKEQFMFQLLKIRQTGYATSVEEREIGTAAISAPVHNAAGELVVALAVSGPAGRMSLEKMASISEDVVNAAKRMGNMVK